MGSVLEYYGFCVSVEVNRKEKVVMKMKKIKFFVAGICSFFVMSYIVGMVIEDPSMSIRGASSVHDPLGKGAYILLFMGFLPSGFIFVFVFNFLSMIQEVLSPLWNHFRFTKKV